MKSENVYKIDNNGNYVPIGLDCDYLPDGIWYVRHHDHVHSISNIKYLEGLFKLSDTTDFPDIKQICSLQEYADFILDSKEFKDLILNERGYTLNELVSLCVSQVFKKNKSLKSRRRKKSVNRSS